MASNPREFTSAQLFDAPKSARKTKVRLARAKLLIIAARKRAAVTTRRYAAQALARPMRLPMSSRLGSMLCAPIPHLLRSDSLIRTHDAINGMTLK